MKTSNEIKAFLIERLEAKDPLALYNEFFSEMEEELQTNHVKSVVYKWQCACREVQKERGWNGIDETFPKSILCWNAFIKSLYYEKPEIHQHAFKEVFGWDIKTVTEGKHCNIAQIIINALQEDFVNRQKERLGLTRQEESV